MKLGLTSEQYDYLLETVVRPIDQAGGTVWIFGSRARGDHKSFSDVDLMIEGEVSSNLVGEIKETLANGNFPYKVDLIQLNDFASSYREGYEREKVGLPMR